MRPRVVGCEVYTLVEKVAAGKPYIESLMPTVVPVCPEIDVAVLLVQQRLGVHASGAASPTATDSGKCWPITSIVVALDGIAMDSPCSRVFQCENRVGKNLLLDGCIPYIGICRLDIGVDGPQGGGAEWKCPWLSGRPEVIRGYRQ